VGISLFGSETEILQTTTENISMGGMFIKMPPHGLKLDQELVVAFSLQTKQGISQHRIPVSVVRSNERGAGLAFSDYSVRTVHMLREFLHNDPLGF
jgi:c-di-GMP-binding flagellar brake protein YcgR